MSENFIADTYKSPDITYTTALRAGTETYLHFPRSEREINVFTMCSECDNTNVVCNQRSLTEIFTLIVYLIAVASLDKKNQTAANTDT